MHEEIEGEYIVELKVKVATKSYGITDLKTMLESFNNIYKGAVEVVVEKVKKIT